MVVAVVVLISRKQNIYGVKEILGGGEEERYAYIGGWHVHFCCLRILRPHRASFCSLVAKVASSPCALVRCRRTEESVCIVEIKLVGEVGEKLESE